MDVIRWNRDELQAMRQDDGEILVPMRPIVDALRMDWSWASRAIKQDPVLGSGVVITSTPDRRGRCQKTICLPLRMLNGWLMKIDLCRYKGERAEKIRRYQEKCYEVLYHHFHPEAALLPSGASEAQLATVRSGLESLQILARKRNARIRWRIRVLMAEMKLTGADFLRFAGEAVAIEGTFAGFEWEKWDAGTVTPADIEAVARNIGGEA